MPRASGPEEKGKRFGVMGPESSRIGRPASGQVPAEVSRGLFGSTEMVPLAAASRYQVLPLTGIVQLCPGERNGYEPQPTGASFLPGLGATREQRKHHLDSRIGNLIHRFQ